LVLSYFVFKELFSRLLAVAILDQNNPKDTKNILYVRTAFYSMPPSYVIALLNQDYCTSYIFEQSTKIWINMLL